MFSSVVNPLPVVLDVDSEDCTIIDVTDIADISCETAIFLISPSLPVWYKLAILPSPLNSNYIGGQAQWVPGDERGVVFVGWENQPQKLGMLYSIYRR